jgi:hypothetical protein
MGRDELRRVSDPGPIRPDAAIVVTPFRTHTDG